MVALNIKKKLESIDGASSLIFSDDKDSKLLAELSLRFAQGACAGIVATNQQLVWPLRATAYVVGFDAVINSLMVGNELVRRVRAGEITPITLNPFREQAIAAYEHIYFIVDMATDDAKTWLRRVTDGPKALWETLSRHLTT